MNLKRRLAFPCSSTDRIYFYLKNRPNRWSHSTKAKEKKKIEEKQAAEEAQFVEEPAEEKEK